MVNSKSALLLAVLAAGFAYQPAGTKAPSSAPEKNQAPAKGARTISFDKELEVSNWTWETIYQSFVSKAQAREAAKGEACKSGEPLPCGIKFIIATVPDPQNSHYPIGFDRMVESIQRALEDSDYTLDRFWLPWDSEPGPVDSDFIMHEQHADWRAAKQTFPGVLLFRPTNLQPDRICVLIVGETPVTGINKLQFESALKTIEHFSDVRKIHILGPAFSGSIVSLGNEISSAGNFSFSVVTGTATSDENQENLNRAASKPVPLARIIGSDEAAIGAFLKYALHKTDCKNIAFLSESGTSYAQSIPTDCQDGDIKTFHYPMQISRMRNAYGAHPELQALSRTTVGDTPGQGLEVPLKDEHDSEDVLPTFSGDLLPVSQEATILNVLATIAHRRIEYLGIVASDILDSMFLGRLLKQHCPNVRPFILDSDLMYGHVSQNNAFDGMLMATNYPLFHKPGQVETQQFSSAAEEGEYRAMRLLIRSMKEGRPELLKTVADSPWLAVMGRDGIWPVREPRPSDHATVFTNLVPSAGWRLFFSLATLFCLAFSGVIIYFNWFGKLEHLPLGWLSALQTNTLDTRIALTVACGLLILFYGFVAALELQSTSDFRYWGRFFCALTLVSLFAAIPLCWGRFKRWQLAPIVVVSLGICVWAYLFFPGSPAFVYRSLHVGNGVSPIVPVAFLFAGLVWMACANLNRIRLLHLFPERSPAFEADSFLCNAEKLHGDLQKILRRWDTGSFVWLAIPAGFCAFSLILLSPSHIFSVETFRFEWLYIAALHLLYCGILVECIRFLRTWSTLHSLLKMLERHVLCEAFKRLPNELSPALLWRWGGGHSFLVLAHFLNRLKRLSDQQSFRFDRSYVDLFKELRRDAKTLMGASTAIHLIEASVLHRTNKHIEEVFASLVTAMSHEWGTFAIQEHQAAAAAGHAAHAHLPVATKSLASETHSLAEEMIALRFVEVIVQVNLQFKNNLEFIAAALILAVISLNSYPFEPHHSLTSMLTIFFFAMSAVFLTVFMQMSRNTIISYLSDTEPGKLDGNLFHILSFGGLPLIAVISSQFPSIGGFLFAWVKPALETLR